MSQLEVRFQTRIRNGKRVGVVTIGKTEAFASGSMPQANAFWNGARAARAGEELKKPEFRGTPSQRHAQQLRWERFQEGYQAYLVAART